MNNHKDVDSMAGNITLGFYRKLYSGMRTGKRINSVSVSAALLFWHLHTVADDYGNLHGDADLVRTWAAPRRKEWDDDAIESMLNELASGERPLIVFYRADGELFIHIEDFEEVQPAGKNGKRVQKHPIHTGGIRVNPGESKGIQGNPEIPGESGSPMPMPITMPMQMPIPTTPAAPVDEVVKHRKPIATHSQIESLYLAYPRRVGKGDAIKAIGKAIDRLTKQGVDALTFLLDRVMAYARSPAGQPPPTAGNDYRPHPARWFNDERYHDDESQWNKPNGVNGVAAVSSPGRVDAPAGKYAGLMRRSANATIAATPECGPEQPQHF